jgi:TFIIF-interacting CTD phosphatase-like protein
MEDTSDITPTVQYLQDGEQSHDDHQEQKQQQQQQQQQCEQPCDHGNDWPQYKEQVCDSIRNRTTPICAILLKLTL